MVGPTEQQEKIYAIILTLSALLILHSLGEILNKVMNTGEKLMIS